MSKTPKKDYHIKLGPPPLANKFGRPVTAKKRKRLDVRDKYGLTLNQRKMIVSLVRGIQFCISKHDGRIHTDPRDEHVERMRVSSVHRLEQLGYIQKTIDTPFYYYWEATKKAREISSLLDTSDTRKHGERVVEEEP